MNSVSNDASPFDLTSQRLSQEDALKLLDGEIPVILPIPNAQACNNLDEYLYKSTATARRSSLNKSQTGSEQRTKVSRKSSQFQEPFAVPLVRNFEKILKDKGPQASETQATGSDERTAKPKRHNQDVFTRAESLEVGSGPFAHLKSRMGKSVKVIVRRRKKVPFISRIIEYRGLLVIFDKHMNLHLKNVIESFTYSKEGRILKRARQRDGIVLRGDNIILVA